MIGARDSALFRPNAQQLAAARAVGVRAWGGYLVSTDAGERGISAFGLLSPWDRASFETVRAAGLRPYAYCSGQDDPGLLRRKAADWNLTCLLDCEAGIRGLGPWTAPWLAASGFGLYGSLATQNAVGAPFRIVAAYPGIDPGATWPGDTPVPTVPHGWQWMGTHDEFGGSVDSLWLDDWFGVSVGAPPPPPRRVSVSLTFSRPPAAVQDTWVDVVFLDPRSGMAYHEAYDPSSLTRMSGPEQLPGLWTDLVSGAPGAGWASDGSSFSVLGWGIDDFLWRLQWTSASGWTVQIL